MRHLAVAAALAAVPGGAGAVTATAMRNDEVRSVGTVRALDRGEHVVTIAYAPLETAPSGVRPVFVVDGRAPAALGIGEAISGIADTRHSPWTLRDVRVLR